MENRLQSQPEKINLFGTKPSSMVDGDGLRYAIFFQGCTHQCKGCHNKQSWDKCNGNETDIQTLITDIKTRKTFIDGVSISGGEPLLQYECLLKLCKSLKKQFNSNIWLWTGFEMSYIKTTYPTILEYVDVIIDGKYEQNNTTKKLYRGSDNQKLWKKNNNIWYINN